MRSIFSRFLMFFGLVALSLQDVKDPLADFCRRFGHQTTIVDRKLYIDGGLLNWNPLSTYPDNYTNTWLLYDDLDTTTSQGQPILHEGLSKNSTVPDVSGGVLWADEVNRVFYQFGGEYNGGPDDFALWSYDIVYDKWDISDNNNWPDLERVAWGAGVADNDLAQGYYFGGWLSNTSVPGWTGPPLATSNLIVYDMISNEFQNNTGPDDTGKAEGIMVYLPASDSGLLVYLGGILDPYKNGTVIPSPLSDIYIYDIASSKWYTQNASGEVPEDRRRFCGGATWAQDHSSFNIYTYGGQGFGENATGFDDVYILSIPSFTWIKWYGGEPGSGYPHHSLSCNVIDGAQMQVIGGTFPATDICDSPDVWGEHNMVLGENGPNSKQWDTFVPTLTKYVVPTAIIDAVGGGPTGGATATAPTSGFDNADLAVYFTLTPGYSARTPTRSIPVSSATANATAPASSDDKKSSNVGVIAGAVVGGVVGLIIILLLVLWCLKRKKTAMKAEKRKSERAELPATNVPSELPSPSEYKLVGSPGTQTATPYVQHSPVGSPPLTSPNGTYLYHDGGHVPQRTLSNPSDPGSMTTPYGSPPPPIPHGSPPPQAYFGGSTTPPPQHGGYPYPPGYTNQYGQPVSPQELQGQGVAYPYPSYDAHSQQYPPPSSPPSRSPTEYQSREMDHTPPTTTSTPAHFYPRGPRRQGSYEKPPLTSPSDRHPMFREQG